jgi:hypothetical protein
MNKKRMLTDQDIQKINESLSPRFEKLENQITSRIETAIENLAIMTSKGFNSTVTIDDFKDFTDHAQKFEKSTSLSLFNLDSKLTEADTRLKKVEGMLEPLFAGYSIMHKEIQDLNDRVSRIEAKAGIGAM